MFALMDYWGMGRPAGASSFELELISRVPEQKYGSKPPLLFIHGAYAGAWCWDEWFLEYFANRGFEAHALSLRGHGRSEGRENLHAFGIGDYVNDVAATVERFERPPVLIGHSMGGMVIQKYLERHDAPATVLMASVPPSGLSGSAMRLFAHDPLLLSRMALIQGGHASPDDLNIARRALLSDAVPQAEARRYARQFQPESQRALWDMTVANLPRRWVLRRPPMLVLGAAEDALFSHAMVRSTARAYGVEAEFFPNMAHGMMLEPAWQDVADRIIDWVAAL